MTLSQWDSLLKHLGAWQGSFTRLSPHGEWVNDVPTCVTLAGINQNETMRQTIQYFSPDRQAVTEEKVLEYASLNRSTLFHEDGAFSQGSIQFGPLAEFGAEFGFIDNIGAVAPGNRRLRLVQLFDKTSNLSSLTLIREQRQDTFAPERPHLTLEQLLGHWHGDAVTLYTDWRSPDSFSTSLTLRVEGNRLHQSLTMPGRELTSTAQIDGSRLLFNQGPHPVQVLLLPDGASCNTPLTIPRQAPFILEAGWLIAPNLRQRLIRSYDAQGGWVSLTLVTEQKVNA
ncbi:DUF3598 family protein [Oculatella sp. LEGE 06141]|uniref:DUF3598 family protein n=1 Tax=Oculatella sp. LEGE 06141 TaxID=1828648 RepID=UPI00187FFF74|nr:DUF3598 family protein [Oculatella sp. LEGE 06141]MBE9180559.1 DUF3598 family protein [Oculatella sp. LEGE 06141]